MANWWQPTAANYFVRIKKDQILQAIQEVTGAPAKECPSRKRVDSLSLCDVGGLLNFAVQVLNG
jgi:hypothetical protein